MKKKLVALSVVMVLAVCITSKASAHTTSLGYIAGINPGEVVFWTGSYAHGGAPVNEGTLTLTGISGTTFGPTTKAFDIVPTSTKPLGLVDGTNNFYWSWPTITFPNNTESAPGLGPVVVWQGVVFSGLNPGDYSASCGATCGTTVQWDSLGSGTVNLTLEGQDIGGGGTSNSVPEPASMLLFASGLVGAFVKRRKRS